MRTAMSRASWTSAVPCWPNWSRATTGCPPSSRNRIRSTTANTCCTAIHGSASRSSASSGGRARRRRSTITPWGRCSACCAEPNMASASPCRKKAAPCTAWARTCSGPARSTASRLRSGISTACPMLSRTACPSASMPTAATSAASTGMSTTRKPAAASPSSPVTPTSPQPSADPRRIRLDAVRAARWAQCYAEPVPSPLVPMAAATRSTSRKSPIHCWPTEWVTSHTCTYTPATAAHAAPRRPCRPVAKGFADVRFSFVPFPGRHAMNPIVSIDDIARAIPSGCRLALPADYAGVAMAVTLPLIRRAPRDLCLVCVPTGGMQVDMLIGAGLVRTIETSAVSLGEAGGAPCFNRAVSLGAIELLDSTCPAVHAGLTAAQKGAPFASMCGLIGTDVLKHRADWRVIDNPFADSPDPVVLVPAIRPDIALLHAPMADREGNVWIGRRRELATMVYASRRAFATVERIVERSLLSDETVAAGVLPALYVEGIALAPRGALPYGLWGEYGTDTAELIRYARAARTGQGFRAYLETAAAECATS